MRNNVVFNSKTYALSNLINDIDTGDIALPDLQRPFVWDSTKVRDLIDSLYKGLPAGVVILWEIVEPGKYRKINLENKREPRFLVIDGQQRLTSLFSIIKNKEIVNKNFKKVKLKISFNPLEEKFEVWNAAIEKDPEWISDISAIFDNSSTYSYINSYLSRIKSKLIEKEIDENKIAANIERVRNLLNYPFSVLELSSSLDPEEVSEIFVRINSKGKSLNQSDFILTLMAVYWEEGRKQIEEFCEMSRRIPNENIPTSFNVINIQPNPEHLVRTIVGCSFLRGRLKYAYLILKGRDFENKVISEKFRKKNFEIFKEEQKKALDLTNWHDFIKIIQSAGFVNDKLISSKIAFFVSYTLYLLGKHKFSIHYKDLETIIRKWFVFSLLTQRYTGSPESVIEKDLTLFKDETVFIEKLEEIMNSELTEDYWKITLPQRLISSSTQNHAYLVYLASLIYRDINVLFSNIKLRDYLNPLLKMKKKTIDLHHIFPKNYLKKFGITDVKNINQIANLIYLEYKENINISDKPPREYWLELTSSLTDEEKNEILKKYDLPQNFWELEYNTFLKERRILMAKGIKEYFKSLNR
ncbi:hypothetical protein BBF96_13765 [Anoxybacter fermentans]|uniref:GmrSD restriction endonucleases N-terminal domain-containing protein n=1 Tax=Anoxybacter fermentans TaxID=1323375 RepID=A0A3Q9HRY2_9FIRM|nr:DUF262 domain-containing protein [Anoxybacter fermentans]AZR74361.1 hypothetical protein BBF96_13765 [Anoxybacter fermentans]